VCPDPRRDPGHS
jgi:hypothetical protein